MNRVTPQMRTFAKRLLADDALENKSSQTAATPVVFRVCERLRPQLAILMGNGGFRALLSRALALASMEVSWLRAVHVKADGSLEGLAELELQADREKVAECGVVLLAQLLELLVAFIGENLTLRLVRELWPQVALEDLDFGNGGRHEKTK